MIVRLGLAAAFAPATWGIVWNIHNHESVGNARYIYLTQEFGLKAGGEINVNLALSERGPHREKSGGNKSMSTGGLGTNMISESLDADDRTGFHEVQEMVMGAAAQQNVALTKGETGGVSSPRFADGAHSNDVYFMLLTEAQLILYLNDPLSEWPTPYVVSTFRKPFPRDGSALNITIPIMKEDLYSALLMQVGGNDIRLEGSWQFKNPESELSLQALYKPFFCSLFSWSLLFICLVLSVGLTMVAGRYRVHGGHRLIVSVLFFRAFSYWLQGSTLSFVIKFII